MKIGLTLFFASFLTLAIVHNLALTFFLYWKYEWFDIFMHFLGGATVAFGVSALFILKVSYFRTFPKLLPVLLLVLIISIAWEIFEIVGDIVVMDETFLPDTILDLIMDMFGGWMGYTVLKKVSS